jgi:hypothetical protein
MKPTPCGKRGYTKREAESMRNELLHRTRRRRGKVRNLRIYACPKCHHWHLTKNV